MKYIQANKLQIGDSVRIKENGKIVVIKAKWIQRALNDDAPPRIVLMDDNSDEWLHNEVTQVP